MGMDVHQDAIAVAYVAHDHGAEVTDLGAFGTRHCAMDHLIRKRPSNAQQLICVSDAGPWGDWLYRYLSTKGDDCWVVAPALLPQKPGDRVNTDRRDAVPVARLARSGARTAVYGPTVADDAMRDRTRARADASSDLQDAKWRLKACWLRHDSRSTGRAHGGAAPLRWLSEVVCPTPAPHIVVPAEVRAVNAHSERLQRLAQARQEPVNAWRLSPVVEARQTWRGVQCTVAVTRVAELGDLTRVESPRELLNWMGLMPAA
jgi:transposase